RRLDDPVDGGKVALPVVQGDVAEGRLPEAEIHDAEHAGERPDQQEDAVVVDAEMIDQPRRQDQADRAAPEREERVPAGIDGGALRLRARYDRPSTGCGGCGRFI